MKDRIKILFLIVLLFIIKLNVFPNEKEYPILLLEGTFWLYIDQDEEDYRIPPFQVEFLKNGLMLEQSPYAEGEIFDTTVWEQIGDVVIMYVNDMFSIEVGLIMSETLINGIAKNVNGVFRSFTMERIKF